MVALLVVLLIAVFPVAASAEDVSFTLGGKVAFTSGWTKWNTSAPSGSPNILSELTWRGVDAVVPEVNAELVWRRLVVLGTFGGGLIRDGVLNDDDFVGNDRQGRVSHTRSDVDGDGLFYGGLDLGYRILRWSPANPLPGYLDLFAGFQYWREDYEAVGARGSVAISNSRTAIREEFTWKSARVGARAQIPFLPWLAGRATIAVVPWTEAQVEDVHPLRTDLRHDPSFRATADGGIGVQADAGLAALVRRGLAIEGGFRYWRIDSGTGSETARTVTGPITQGVNEIIVERYGPYIGLTYRF